MSRDRAEIPDLREFLNRRKDEILSQLNCISLGTIQVFYPDSQTADILINFKRTINTDVPTTKDYPMLLNCPVVVLNGGGAYVSFPIAQGDTCLVLFCDRDIDNWFEDGQASAPNSSRVHDLSDGIALVGIRSKRNPLVYDKDRLKLFFGNGYMTIDSEGNISLSSPKTINVLASDDVDVQAGKIAQFKGDGGVGYLQVDASGNIKILGTTINIQNIANSGYLTIDASGNLALKGYTITFFGTQEDKSVNTVYQAATDGLVTCISTGDTLGTGLHTGYTDGSNPPTTEWGKSNIVYSSADVGFFLMPVKKGNYWKVATSTNGTSVVKWTPIGS